MSEQREKAIEILEMFKTPETNINGFGYSQLQRDFARKMILEIIKDNRESFQVAKEMYNRQAEGLIAGIIVNWTIVLEELNNV